MPPNSFGDCGAHRPAFFRLLAHRFEARVRDVLVVGEILRIGFQRQHVLGDEGAHAQAQVFDFGGEGEVHYYSQPFSVALTELTKLCRALDAKHFAGKIHEHHRSGEQCGPEQHGRIAGAARL